ncbi:hypothetical protein [Terriglobus saanensis]|uniref:Uncharacterized protein n=1 Tax=Terriglobus saanensis (strain ATCC BAA-1853 / DSM 23119 / SP1PR4) TaxID=401053 RepID=E8UYF5_TERSS|nr:hypothetical protein [Terriglobus saanensis]ADV82043.1 hypothetical protein AciPR4_1218 [Terriglobus saanensis SP1PR4]
MANFLVRVELQGNPIDGTYDKLHSCMESLGFKQTFTSAGEELTHLPHAMYEGSWASSTSSLCVAVKNTVKANIWPKPVILAIEYNTFALFKA